MTFRSIGVTGSREGPVTEEQAETSLSLFEYLWENHDPHEFHHGDCVGVDEWAATTFGQRMYLVGHPPIDPVLRAFVHSDFEYEPEPYLARNRSIVLESDIVVALPKRGDREGGTGYTIEFARQTETDLVIVYRDGSALIHAEGLRWNL